MILAKDITKLRKNGPERKQIKTEHTIDYKLWRKKEDFKRIVLIKCPYSYRLKRSKLEN